MESKRRRDGLESRLQSRVVSFEPYFSSTLTGGWHQTLTNIGARAGDASNPPFWKAHFSAHLYSLLRVRLASR